MLITPFFLSLRGNYFIFNFPVQFSGSSSPCRPSPSLLAEGDTTILWLALALALVLQDADLQPWISNLKFAASKTLVNEKLIN
jgi:hypothetical protein